MRTRAAESGEYAGNDDPVFAYLDGAKNPQTASVTVYRMVQGQRCGFTATARWAEYYPGDAQGWAWKKMPHIMLGKCAEGLALRKAFPQQLAGLYAAEEMDQAGGGHIPASKSGPQLISGKLSECKAFESCSIAKIGKHKVVVMDTGHDALLVNLGSSSTKHEVEVEVSTKSGPKGDYLELVRIAKIDGADYLEGALKASLEAAKKPPRADVEETLAGVFADEPKKKLYEATDEDIPF
jgi:hypothetical protein